MKVKKKIDPNRFCIDDVIDIIYLKVKKQRAKKKKQKGKKK